MAQLTPYVFFDGSCREAMEFYKECLGAELTMQAVGDTPAAEHMPPEARQKIMHAALTRGEHKETVLMASDWMGQGKFVNGNSISLSIHCTSDAEIKALFAGLSAGGKVTMPLADQFWGATFGTLVDKFGIAWMLNYDKIPRR
jgi:PhnB protein